MIVHYFAGSHCSLHLAFINIIIVGGPGNIILVNIIIVGEAVYSNKIIVCIIS